MSSLSRDNCILCLKLLKQIHKNITCKKCGGYVHKKCTKLKPKELKQLQPGDWACPTCILDVENENIDKDESELNNVNVPNVDLTKFDKMVFNPLRFDSTSIKCERNDIIDTDYDGHECSYLSPEQFCSTSACGKFNLLNINIRGHTILTSYKNV